MYQPSIGKRTRPTPQPILTRRDLLPLNAVAPEAVLTPSLPSAGTFKNSLHRLLRKRTALHLKNSSQSSSSTTSPSETSADAEDSAYPDLEEASDDEYRSSMGYSPYTHDDPFHPQPPYTGVSSPFSGPRPPARGRASGPLDDQFPADQLPPRSSSVAR